MECNASSLAAGMEGAVQELPAASGQRRAGNGQAAKAPDYAGAYSSNGQRSPAHEQWCSLVGIFGVSMSLVEVLSPSRSVTLLHACECLQSFARYGDRMSGSLVMAGGLLRISE